MLESTLSARETRKLEQGCVFRAIQSAMGVDATEGEWDIRFRQIDILRKKSFWRELPEGPERTQAINDEYQQEIGNLLELLEILHRGATPLARRLQSHAGQIVYANNRLLHSFLDAGKKVLVMQPHHIKHVSKLGHSDLLINESDKSHNIWYLPRNDKRCELLVFTPLR